ncbi:MAG: PilN domain-containing protein [Candidatus Omnitrophica bacterium]|nr:PilN domain-containing protein [Candidatus Omnitrophota bacterium]
MIEINLLPEEYRKRKKKKIIVLPKGLGFFIGLWFFGLFIMFGLLLNITVESKNAKVEKLEKEWALLQPKKTQLETLKTEASTLEGELNLFRRVLYKRFYWSEKLNKISDNILDGVWLNSLSIGTGEENVGMVSAELPRNAVHSLTISGSVFSRVAGEEDSISQFIKSLKEDKEFSKDFKDIELKSVQTKKIADKEVKDFVIILSLKEEEPIE